jgi:SAM-dependent methyltransferase
MLHPLSRWVTTAAQRGDPVEAARAAAEAAGPDPWRILATAGRLARARWATASSDLGLSDQLLELPVDDPRAILRIAKGAPYPTEDRVKRRRRGAFDTPRDLVHAVVDAALLAAEGRTDRGADLACGTGAFLVALAERGFTEIHGVELDPAAAEVARVAVPSAHIVVGDSFRHPLQADVVVGNPPFVPAERQRAQHRKGLRKRYPWLSHRFDLSLPFAALAAECTRPGGGMALILPRGFLFEPYAAPLRRQWLAAHRITTLTPPVAFPGTAIHVSTVALQRDGQPGPLPGHGIEPAELLQLETAPLHPWAMPGDVDLLRRIQAKSVPLGEIAEVDTGVSSHGPDGGKARLLHDGPGSGRVPYVDARDLLEGRVRWLHLDPARMHRAKRPALFADPKILVQRLRGRGPVRAWIDTTGTWAGHTLNIVRPLDPATDLDRLHDWLSSPLLDALLRIERGVRIDLYPKDLRGLPFPRAWLPDAQPKGPPIPLAEAWSITPAEVARLEKLVAGVRGAA